MKILRIGMLIGFIASQMLQPMVWATDINDADVDPALIQQAVNSSFTTEEQAAEVDAPTETAIADYEVELDEDSLAFDADSAASKLRDLQASVDIITEQLFKLDEQQRTESGSISDSYRETRTEIVNVINNIKSTTNEVEQLLRKTAIYQKQIEEFGAKVTGTRGDIANLKIYLADFSAALYQAQQHLYTEDGSEIDDVKLMIYSDNIARTIANDQLITSMVKEMTDGINTLEVNEDKQLDTLKKLTQLRNLARANISIYNQELDKLEQKRDYLGQFMELYQGDTFLSPAGIDEIFQNRKSVFKATNTLLDNIESKKYGVSFDIAGSLAKLAEKETDKLEHVIAWPVYPVEKINTFFWDEKFREDNGFPHWGIQIEAAQKTPVYAARDGVVYHVTNNDGIGINWMMVIHTDGYVSVYTYMNTSVVKPGDIVQRGQLLGYSGGEPGTRGAGFVSPGANLTFSIYRDGEALDPLKLLDLAVVADKDMLPNEYHIKFLRDKYARPIDITDLAFAEGETTDDRAIAFLKSYGVGIYRSLTFWNNAVKDTNIDRDVTICIAFAESTLGRYLSTDGNIGNVGNNDRWDRFAFGGALAGARAIAQTLNNQHLGDYHTIIQLSRYGNEDGKIYASSPINWQTNVTKCLSQIKWFYATEDFPFRTAPNPNKDNIPENDTPAAAKFDWEQVKVEGKPVSK